MSMSTINQNEIILINLGNHQSYIIDNIKNLQLFNNNNITVITERSFFEYFKDMNINLIDTCEIDIENFEFKNKLDNSFRNGFWKYASKRIFYLYYYMKNYSKTNCFHIENDIMVYTNLSNLKSSDKLTITLDTFERCIPGIIFVPNFQSLNEIISNWNYTLNDMDNIGICYINNKSLYDTFPIIKKNISYNENNVFTNNFEKYNSIFDAAAIGQYLGGVDPRNLPGDTIGFVNCECKVNYSFYSFYWKKNLEYNNLYSPYILIDNNFILVNNLHIHSKRLFDFMGSKPKENKIIKYINK
jgi:hypothetical protein